MVNEDRDWGWEGKISRKMEREIGGERWEIVNSITNLLMSHVEVPTQYQRLLRVQALQILPKVLIPLLSIV